MNTAPKAIRSRVFYVLLLGLQEVSIKKICETAGSHHAGHFPVDFRRLFPEGAALCNSKRTRSGSTKEAFSDWIEEVEENEIPAFMKSANTYRNRFTPITNFFFCPYLDHVGPDKTGPWKILK